MDNALGANEGVTANPAASIYIAVTDTNFHYLTVVSPAQFNNPRKFTMRLTSTNNTSAAYAGNENTATRTSFNSCSRETSRFRRMPPAPAGAGQ